PLELPISEDELRRSKQFYSILQGKVWADIGSGLSGTLRLLKDYAKISHGVEPQNAPRELINKIEKIKIFKDINELEDNFYDVITLFHVFEHFSDPISNLITLKKKLAKNGKLIIEVPHARDALITLYNNASFRDFTFWSEHLILHTRESLKQFLNVAGFNDI
ncbi:MAG: class I SAM-dependent methyltransferase, partial [Oligoflexia bacterium]|nr:class I SAM-dependent methyltransferase [Oligoflexia bacterium]